MKFIANLSKRRKLFHSEADFQHEFALEIKENIPLNEVRLEKPIFSKILDKYIYLDLFEKNTKTAIELKYKTRKFEYLDKDEKFLLKNHAATNLGRYDFLADLSRLEKIKEEGLIQKGFCIFLSNDESYWSGKPKHSILSEDFYISEGYECKGTLKWLDNVKISSIGKSRVDPIELCKTYSFRWNNYSDINEHYFKSLIVEI